jgi:glycyl-tRNA synthetase beta chain
MVGEFPELQGLIGGHLARAQGHPAEVADAIRDHYKPVGQGDEVPTAPVTVAVSLADKLDTIEKFFSIGESPTGSKDPYALRRAAIAVCELIRQNKLGLNLSGVIGISAREFIVERHRTLLRQKGFRVDVISAVRRFGGFNLLEDERKITDLTAFLRSENAQALVGGLKRVYNILRDVERAEPSRTGYAQPTDDGLTQPEEKRLFEGIWATAPIVKGRLSKNDFKGALEELATLRPSIDSFFDNVRVNVGDAQIRESRLALLNFIRLSSLTVADFAELEG